MPKKRSAKGRQSQTKDANAATSKTRWLTALGPDLDDDGEVEVNVDANGKITGNYLINGLPSGDPINGYYIDSRPPRMHYERTEIDTGNTRTYDGRIFLFNLPLQSVLSPFFLIVGKHSGPTKLDDDDWMGGHTT